MARVLPMGGAVSSAVMVSVAPEQANDRSLRRPTTIPRFQGLPQVLQKLAFEFRSFVRPRTHFSLPTTFAVCALLQLLVAVPYGSNERASDGSPLHKALRGLIVGVWMYFMIGPLFLVAIPMLVRGGFHVRFLLPFPITLGASVAVAFIPIAGSTLGIVSIGLLTIVLTFIACELLLSVPFYATDEHMALDINFGPPLFVIAFLFFALITAYITLTQHSSSAFVGLLIPAGSVATRVLAIYALGRCCHTFYYVPKQTFLMQLATTEPSQAIVVPPILGDIESLFGYAAAFFALIIGNAASVATLVEVVLSPASTAWALSLAASALLTILTCTRVMQRAELWAAARLAAQFGLQWPARFADSDALELLYLRSLGGTGYVALMVAISIGCVRAVTFGDPAAIVWLDVSPTVWRVLLAQLLLGAMADATVRTVARNAMQHFELSARFAAGHPLRNTAFRDFDLNGYAFVFGMGGAFIYGVFVAFLGPAFVMGLCRDFAPNATHVWVQRALECANGSAGLGWANGTLDASAVSTTSFTSSVPSDSWS
jgi:hypothetical protein